VEDAMTEGNFVMERRDIMTTQSGLSWDDA
jgi:hypothetical protein